MVISDNVLGLPKGKGGGRVSDGDPCAPKGKGKWRKSSDDPLALPKSWAPPAWEASSNNPQS